MDSNHRCLGVGQESLPLDHGIFFVLNAFQELDGSRWSPRSLVMRSAAEAVGLEPTIRARRTPVFETGPSSGRMTSSFLKALAISSPQVAGAGIEPAASGFRARRHYQQQLPRSNCSSNELLLA